MSAGPCPRRRDVDAHFRGRLGPRGEETLRDHLVSCDACRGRYQGHLRLAALDPRALSYEARMAIGLGLRRRAVLGWPGAAAALGVALCAWLFIGGPAARPAGDQLAPAFHPRGAGAGALVLTLDGQATEVLGFRTGGGERAVLAGGRIQVDEELAFAYRNGGRWGHLMIFARDERGNVYWFHPQWANPAADPQAVPLLEAPGLHELPTAVAHHFPPGRLALCALVARQTASVRQVEAVLAGAPDQAPVTALADLGAVSCRDLQVER